MIFIRRPRPSPRQGRRLGPPEVWNFALLSQAKAHAFPRQQLCQLHAPAIYMPLPSVFQGVQDCRLPGFKRSKPFRKPPRQQLLQLHAPAIYFSRGSRLLFARPQTLQTLPQASKATTLTATCPCHLFFKGFKSAACLASNAPKPFRRPPRQQLLQLHAPAICFSGGSRLPFARPQTLQTLPQASKATTLTATCPCHLFFRGFKTAVCPPSNAPNPSAGLQGNNSYSYMPLPSVFQGVQDCRLPAFKRSKPFRGPPRQQLLQLIQLHAPAICFSGGSRLPFARPQTLQTLPQASKATTLTATCPCHLFFRGFKTAICPPSNAPNPSASLQGNNSYSYMPLPSVFQGVQDCRLPALKRSKPFRRPPRQQLLQLHAPAICFSGGSRLPFARPPTLQTLPQAPRQQLLQLHAPAIWFSGGSRLPFARPQTLQTLPQASKATTLTATCPCHLFFKGFKTAVCPPSNAPNPSAGLQGNNSYSYMPLPSVFQGVQDCRLPALKRSKPFRRPPRQQLLQLHAPAICFSGGSRLPFARPQTLQTLPQASKATTLTVTCPFFSGGSRLPFARLKRSKPFRRPPRQQLLQLHAPAICFSGGSRLPFARPQTLQTLPEASKATTLTATCPCHAFFRGFKTAVCPPSNAPNPSAGLQGNNSYSYMPLPSVFQGVQDCRLPALKRSKPFRKPPRQQLLQLHASAICFSGGSRLPFACPQTLQTLPQVSKATTLTATCPCHLFFRGSRLPFARPQTLQTLPQASKATTLTATCPCHLFFRGFKTAVCPPSNAPNTSAGLQGNNSYSYMPLPSVFQGVQDCRLPALKRSKPFRKPPRQQLLQLHAPAICFSGGSRLPFARLQTLQTLPQASKATTLTATCPCHLFFRGFKTAVCLASKAPNPSAGLQGNNSYSHMPLPSVFQGVQDCRLPALKRSKPFRRPPRQQLLQLHAPAICFSRGSRLPFARFQTLQTLSAGLQGNNSYSYMPLPSVFQGVQDCRLPALKRSKPFRRPPRQQLLQLHAPAICKATTLTATCPCHLFFRGFKTAVCLASNAPNPSAGLQGNNSYSYMPLPSVFQGVQDCRLPALKRSKPFRRPPRQQLLQLHAPAPAICFSGGSRLPFARPQTLQTLPQASKATTLTATCPCHLCFRGFKTAVCPPSNAPRRFPRQQLLQLHAPAICFSGGSRLPFARLQTLQTLPQASKATTLTATCPCHPFSRGFKTAVCPLSNAPNPSAGLQGNNSYSYMPLPSVFQGVQDCRLPALKRSKPFRKPPRQQLLQLHAPAICFSGGSRLPFARPQTLQTLPQSSKATTLTATCPCHLFFKGFKTAVCPPSNAPNPSAGLQGNNSYSYMPLPSVFQGVQDCRLPALKRSKPFRKPPRQQLLQLHAPAICFSGGSRLPFARPQTLQTLPQASKATTLTATCPCHLFFKGFKTAVCPPLNAPNPSAGLQGNNSYSYMPLPSVFRGVQDCRLPALKRSKPFRRPPRQQLLQLHAPAICFSGGSRLPFARPQTLQTLPQASRATTLTATCPCHLSILPFAWLQTLQTLPQASKATTLTATCPCHLFFRGFKTRLPFARPQTLQTLPQASKATTLTATCPCHRFFKGFKTAVCLASKAPNPSVRLQGNNSYSYMMPLPSVFQGVQDCRLPALKRSKPFRRPPRQQLLQLHAPAICFSGGSRLPFAWLQTLQTLPQASKATTLAATCPCHLFFRGFKTAVCLACVVGSCSDHARIP